MFKFVDMFKKPLLLLLSITLLNAANLFSGTVSLDGKIPKKQPQSLVPEETPEFSYKIAVNIQGYRDSVLYLARYFADKQYISDTASADRGYAVFTGHKKLSRGLYMITNENKEILFETIIADDQFFYIAADTTYDHNKLDAKGSFENEKFVEYQQLRGEIGSKHYRLKFKYDSLKNAGATNVVLDPVNEQMKAADKEIETYKNNYIKSYPTHYLTHLFNALTEIEIPKPLDPKDSLFEFRYYVNHYWDNVDFSDEGMLSAPTSLLKRMLDVYMDKLTYQEPDSLIKAVDIIIAKAAKTKDIERYFIVSLTSKYETSNIMCQDKVFEHLAHKYYCSGRAWWADSTLIKNICKKADDMMFTECGGIAKDLNMEDTAGKLHRLYEITQPYTILFFYDPTCSHCKKVIPVVADIYRKYNKKGVAVYAISTEGKYTEWKELVRNNKDLNGWINVCKTSRYYPWPLNKQDYHIEANPTVFILDKNKKIVAKKIDEHNMLEFLEHMMFDDGVIKKEEMTPPAPKKAPEPGEDIDNG